MNERVGPIGAVAADLHPLVAPWLVEASRPFADWYFGEPDVADEILREWMARPTSEMFIGRAIVYEDAAGVGGCILTMDGAELARCRAADFATFCAELGSGPEADDVATEIMTASQELFPAVAVDELYISRVGVDPARRGQGVGRRMVTHLVEAARASGLRRCRLDVSADNAAAIRAYEAAGLRVEVVSESASSGLTYCSMVTTA